MRKNFERTKGKEEHPLENKPELRKRSSRLATYAMLSLMALGIAERATAQNQEALPQESKGKKEFSINVVKIESEYRATYERVEQKIKEHDLERKFEFLKNRYGDGLDNFLGFTRIQTMMDAVRKIREGLSEGNKEVFVKKNSPFIATQGSILAGLEERWQAVSDEKIDSLSKTVITGFDSIPGFSDQRLSQELRSQYSKRWIEGSIKNISYTDEVNPSDEYGRYVLGGARTFGIGSMLEPDQRAPIHLYNMVEGHTAGSILYAVQHETFHSNDWESSRTMPAWARLDMLYEMTLRFDEEGSYRTPYLDSIQNLDVFGKGEEINQTLEYVLVAEFAAEIHAALMSNPASFERDYPKDAELAKKWFNRINEGAFNYRPTPAKDEIHR